MLVADPARVQARLNPGGPSYRKVDVILTRCRIAFLHPCHGLSPQPRLLNQLPSSMDWLPDKAIDEEAAVGCPNHNRCRLLVDRVGRHPATESTAWVQSKSGGRPSIIAPRLNPVPRRRRILLSVSRSNHVWYVSVNDRMGVRVVEGTSLENWRRCKPTVGSNPTPSAGGDGQIDDSILGRS